MVGKPVMLSTMDNPYNPFVNFDEWLRYDMDKGYNSCAYLDRVAHTSDQFSDTENDEEIEAAIDEIILYDPFNIYCKVNPDSQTPMQKLTE